MNKLLLYLLFLPLSFSCLATTANVSLANESQVNESANNSIKKNSFPWYESDTGKFKPVGKIRSKRKPKEKVLPSPEVSLDPIALVMRILFWALIILVVAWLVIMVVRAIQDIPEKEHRREDDMPTFSQERLELLPEITRGVTDFLGEAAKQASAGNFSRAMVFYYSWQLLMLGDQEVIELESGKTNRQYLREAKRNRPNIIELFTHSIRMFEDAIYGGIELGKSEFVELWKQREKLKPHSKRRAS